MECSTVPEGLDRRGSAGGLHPCSIGFAQRDKPHPYAPWRIPARRTPNLSCSANPIAPPLMRADDLLQLLRSKERRTFSTKELASWSKGSEAAARAVAWRLRLAGVVDSPVRVSTCSRPMGCWLRPLNGSMSSCGSGVRAATRSRGGALRGCTARRSFLRNRFTFGCTLRGAR